MIFFFFFGQMLFLHLLNDHLVFIFSVINMMYHVDWFANIVTGSQFEQVYCVFPPSNFSEPQ